MQKKILFVEDEEFIRELYERQLKLAGFQTDTSETGMQGLEMAKKTKYDLLLLDIMLPDINGIEVLKKAKEGTINKDTLSVFLTNLGQDEIVKEALSEGAAAYLIKARYTPDQIVDEIKKILVDHPTPSEAPAPIVS